MVQDFIGIDTPDSSYHYWFIRAGFTADLLLVITPLKEVIIQTKVDA